MNAERLLAHYEQIADAPDAIARLRRFILDLAVRGKLVPQDSTEEPASELLIRIAKEKSWLDRKERTSRLSRNLVSDAERVQLPKGWALAALGDLVTVLNGRAYKQHELLSAGVPVLRVGNLFTSDRWYYSTLKLEEDKYCDKGDLIFAWSASFGPFIWSGEKVIYHYHIWKLPLHSEADLNKLYLYNFLLQKTREIKEAGHGISMIHMTKEKTELIQVPLPPLAEQRRIVAKVDDLMGLCDRLEAARGSREAVRNRLAAASLARLNAPDPKAFQADARFVLDALPALTTRPDQIKQFRQTILNLAVRGKLVPQDSNDELACKFDRTIPDDLERPFEIPRTWNWARLHTLGKLKGGGTPSKARSDFWNGNIPWVSPKDMKIDHVAVAQMSISESAIAGSAANLIDVGSVLFVVRGMILAHSFPVAVSTAPLAINQDMKALTLKKPEMAEFILRALKGVKPEILKRVQRSSHGTCRLEGSDYSDFLIPIPPLAEQYRIVARVDALLALCDRLEASLTATAATRRRLLDALLAEALAPAEDREMEAAE
jgi:type I restriction enzyme S subunit